MFGIGAGGMGVGVGVGLGVGADIGIGVGLGVACDDPPSPHRVSAGSAIMHPSILARACLLVVDMAPPQRCRTLAA